MSEQTAYSKQFTSDVRLLLQNSGGKLYGCVDHQSCEGEAAVLVEQIGEAPSREAEAPNTPLKIDKIEHERPWIFPVLRETNPVLNEQDTLRQAAEFGSSYQMAVKKALARHQDQVIIGSYFAPVRKGRESQKSVSYPTDSKYNVASDGGSPIAGQAPAAGTHTGLTPGKVMEADRKLGDFDNEEEERYVAITPRQNSELASYDFFGNKDWTNKMPVMDSGKVVSFFGYMFKETTLLRALNNAAGDRISIPMWTKSGIKFGTWKPATVDVDKRIDLTWHPTQFYGRQMIGAARTEEERVIRIACAI